MGGHADGGGEKDPGAPACALRPAWSRPLNDAPAIRRLLTGAIDYAGLFPPASLGVSEAAGEYASYRAGPDAWALGRFVVPWSSLGDLTSAAIGHAGTPWPVSVVLPPGPPLNDVTGARTSRETVLALEAIEVKATPAVLDALVPGLVQAGFEVFVEVALDGDVERAVAEVAATGAMAKVRTGGTTVEAFPRPTDLLRFMRACLTSGVRFKATAGLHHPLRGEYRLTYDPGSATGTMYGYLNVMVAAALLRLGAGDQDALAALTEQSAEAFRVEGDRIIWRDLALSSSALRELRAGVFTGFGSCSFREPMDELPAVLAAGSRS